MRTGWDELLKVGWSFDMDDTPPYMLLRCTWFLWRFATERLATAGMCVHVHRLDVCKN